MLIHLVTRKLEKGPLPGTEQLTADTSTEKGADGAPGPHVRTDHTVHGAALMTQDTRTSSPQTQGFMCSEGGV